MEVICQTCGTPSDWPGGKVPSGAACHACGRELGVTSGIKITDKRSSARAAAEKPPKGVLTRLKEAAGRVFSGKKAPEQLPQATSLGLWKFLWGAGSRRLHLEGDPSRGARDDELVVESVPEILALLEDARRTQAVLAGLEVLLQQGYLETWLLEALGDHEGAEATRAIRVDDRGQKVLRWLQRAGLRSYFVAGAQVDSIEQFAQLPLHVTDLSEAWEHIRERVPQERWAGDARAVAILDGVRAESDIPLEARALIACLRLGLKQLPVATGAPLARLEDLGRVLDASGGRENLYELLNQHALETWAEQVAPGAGARVARVRQDARGGLEEIAVDRAVRLIGIKGLYVVPGLRAGSYPELCALARSNLQQCCGSSAARDRIREALFNQPEALGAPAGATDCDEAELGQHPEQLRPWVFAWTVLELKELWLHRTKVDTVQGMIAAIAELPARTAAQALASTGALGLWLTRAQHVELPGALAGNVTGDFPALCLELGEPPPRIETSWLTTHRVAAEGGEAQFDLTLRNLDPVREAVLIFQDDQPADREVSMPGPLSLAPASEANVAITYLPPMGVSGTTTIEVQVAAAHPVAPRPLGGPHRLQVKVAFPWWGFSKVVLAWTAAIPLGLVVVRAVLEPFVGALLHDGSRILVEAPRESLWGAGMAFVAAALVVEHLVLALVARRFWLHACPASLESVTQTETAIVFAGIVGLASCFHGCSQVGVGTGLGRLFTFSIGTVLMMRLARRDAIAAALVTAGLIVGEAVGSLFLDALGGLDALAMALGFGLGGPSLGGVIIAGWGVAGLGAGLAYGLALSFRAIHRSALGEVARALVLLAMAGAVWWLRAA